MMTTYPSSPRSLAIGAAALATLLVGGCSTDLDLDDNITSDTTIDETATSDVLPDTDDSVSVELSTPEVDGASFAAPFNVLPTQGYYSIERDVRRCDAPECGGFFITALNGADACPEVAQRRGDRCYVLDLEAFSPLEDGDVVRVSSFDPAIFPGSDETPYLIASVDYVFAPVLEDTFSNGFRMVYFDEGVRTVARVNTRLSGTPDRILAFADSSEELGLLVDAYNENRELGGALTGGYVTRAGDYVVTNVWAAKESGDVPVEQPVCVVADQGATTTAWNFEDLEAAADLLASLEETADFVEVYEGFCGDQLLFCTLEFNPVSGTIDALGDVCVDAGNPCGFRSAVIAAAGGADNPGKAQGTYTLGGCPVCVVADREQTTTAWNFENRAAAEDLISGLEQSGDEVVVYTGFCGDQLLFCPLVFIPVSGVIDALNICVDGGNPCEFRSEVIAAAGGADNPSKAQGTYDFGTCGFEPDTPRECPACEN